MKLGPRAVAVIVATGQELEGNPGGRCQPPSVRGRNDLVVVAVEDELRAAELADRGEVVEPIPDEKRGSEKAQGQRAGGREAGLEHENGGGAGKAEGRNRASSQGATVEDDLTRVDAGLGLGPVVRRLEGAGDRLLRRLPGGPAIPRVLDEEDGHAPVTGLAEGCGPVVDELGIPMGEEDQGEGAGARVPRREVPGFRLSSRSIQPDLLDDGRAGRTAPRRRRKDDGALQEEEKEPVGGYEDGSTSQDAGHGEGLECRREFTAI